MRGAPTASLQCQRDPRQIQSGSQKMIKAPRRDAGHIFSGGNAVWKMSS